MSTAIINNLPIVPVVSLLNVKSPASSPQSQESETGASLQPAPASVPSFINLMRTAREDA